MPRIIDPARDELDQIDGELTQLLEQSNARIATQTQEGMQVPGSPYDRSSLGLIDARGTISSQQLSGAHPLSPNAGQALDAARQGNWGEVYGADGSNWNRISPAERRQIRDEHQQRQLQRQPQPQATTPVQPRMDPQQARLTAQSMPRRGETAEDYRQRLLAQGLGPFEVSDLLDRFKPVGEGDGRTPSERRASIQQQQAERNEAINRRRAAAGLKPREDRQRQQGAQRGGGPLEASRDGMLPHGARRSARGADAQAVQFNIARIDQDLQRGRITPQIAELLKSGAGVLTPNQMRLELDRYAKRGRRPAPTPGELRQLMPPPWLQKDDFGELPDPPSDEEYKQWHDEAWRRWEFDQKLRDQQLSAGDRTTKYPIGRSGEIQTSAEELQQAAAARGLSIDDVVAAIEAQHGRLPEELRRELGVR